ncbi:MAG: DUF2934 domain-containing protein [Terriglobales bacterium]
MARKTNGSPTTTRSKKTAVSTQPAAVQVAPEINKEVVKAVVPQVPTNGKSVNLVPSSLAPSNLEEEIRRRAYELYQQRSATAGSDSGDQNQDWLMAEHEIRARYNKLARHATA